ncbi:hypothetical protein E2C01_021614 [Portunus trituberculatus]|uniref:Uncharacterized protein n=1 Tax=Portunus trituberculatus TaxID=210409 RepID=A0A5B7E363_PORTR|nr:hypothetical protein [Portunus trituberculatus]
MYSPHTPGRRNTVQNVENLNVNTYGSHPHTHRSHRLASRQSPSPPQVIDKQGAPIEDQLTQSAAILPLRSAHTAIPHTAQSQAAVQQPATLTTMFSTYSQPQVIC